MKYMITKKLYYEDFYLGNCKAKVIGKKENGVVLDQTVAFPEGGGQEGDRGIIVLKGETIPFYDTKKGLGRVLTLSDFPTIQVDTPVYHFVENDKINVFDIGDEVEVKVDIPHRIRTTTLHSALHIALMAAKECVPEKVKLIKGCSITEEYGRLDFFTREKFTAEDIDCIERKVNEIISSNYLIESYQHPNEPEAWYWKCKNFVCPCGGTHLRSTGEAGVVHVKRKNVGKTTERLVVTISKICLKEESYRT